MIRRHGWWGGCKNKAQEATTSNAETAMTVVQEADKYTANVGESTIEWQGFKPTGSDKGTINIVSGEFNVSNGQCRTVPQARLKCYPLRVQGDEITLEMKSNPL